MSESYKVKFNGHYHYLPLVSLGDSVIALFDCNSNISLINDVASDMDKLIRKKSTLSAITIKEHLVIITAESKGAQIGAVLANKLMETHPQSLYPSWDVDLIVLRKTDKPYIKNNIVLKTSTVTSGDSELYFDSSLAKLITPSTKVVLMDDVVSSGATRRAFYNLLDTLGVTDQLFAEVYACAEGSASDMSDPTHSYDYIVSLPLSEGGFCND